MAAGVRVGDFGACRCAGRSGTVGCDGDGARGAFGALVRTVDHRLWHADRRVRACRRSAGRARRQPLPVRRMAEGCRRAHRAGRLLRVPGGAGSQHALPGRLLRPAGAEWHRGDRRRRTAARAAALPAARARAPVGLLAAPTRSAMGRPARLLVRGRGRAKAVCAGRSDPHGAARRADAPGRDVPGHGRAVPLHRVLHRAGGAGARSAERAPTVSPPALHGPPAPGTLAIGELLRGAGRRTGRLSPRPSRRFSPWLPRAPPGSYGVRRARQPGAPQRSARASSLRLGERREGDAARRLPGRPRAPAPGPRRGEPVDPLPDDPRLRQQRGDGRV